MTKRRPWSVLGFALPVRAGFLIARPVPKDEAQRLVLGKSPHHQSFWR